VRGSFLFAPEAIVPLPVFLRRYFPIPGSGVEALMTQVLLKHSQSISRIIVFNGVHCEGFPEFVRTNIMYFAGFWIYELWQSGFFGALLYDLPGPVSIDTEDESFSVLDNRTATLDVFLEYLQSILVNGQHPLAAFLLFFDLAFFYLTATSWAEDVGCTKSCSAGRARQLQTAFQVNNGNGALREVDIINLDRQGFSDSAA
jgi:hypothetical protein